MGLRIGFHSCATNYRASASDTPVYAPAPNPHPSRWVLQETAQFENGYVLKVRYLDCTNFEGVKVMVYKGQYRPRKDLDPHFYNGDDAPVARFRPDAEGWRAACNFAKSL